MRRSTCLCLITLPAWLGLASCTRAPQADAAAAPAAVAARGASNAGIPVTTALAVAKALPVVLQAVGNVEASSTVDVRPQVSGPLLSVHFTEGQDVEAGQLLFTIDRRPFELALRQAQAQLGKNSAQPKTAEAQRARYRELLNRGLVSTEQHDAVTAQADALQSSIAADDVQVETAQLQLQHTEIRAPIAGRTGTLRVHAGSLVRTADLLPLVVINQITPVQVVFSVPATHLPAIVRGHARAALPTDAWPAKASGAAASRGALSFIDHAIDPTTSAIRLKATFPNRDRQLWPGEFVQVRVQLAVDPAAIVVPLSAIQTGPKGQYVYVVTSGTATMRPVTVLRTAERDVVVGEGLRAGEEVVTDGQLRLTPGAKVTIAAAGNAS
jgi:multidrug efflux system membrane fusion protein